MVTETPHTSRQDAKLRRGVRWLKWLVVAAAAAGAWHLYVNRPPDCAALAEHGAKEVENKYCLVPNALKVSGAWNWKRLPERLVVHGDLTIEGTNIDRLPEGLIVDGDIYLYKTDVAQLPNNLWVQGNIDQHSGMYAAIPVEELAAWHARRGKQPPRPVGAP